MTYFEFQKIKDLLHYFFFQKIFSRPIVNPIKCRIDSLKRYIVIIDKSGSI